MVRNTSRTTAFMTVNIRHHLKYNQVTEEADIFLRGEKTRMVSEEFKGSFEETFRWLINLISLFYLFLFFFSCLSFGSALSRYGLPVYVYLRPVSLMSHDTIVQTVAKLWKEMTKYKSSNDLCPHCGEGSKKLSNSWKAIPSCWVQRGGYCEI